MFFYHERKYKSRFTTGELKSQYFIRWIGTELKNVTRIIFGPFLRFPIVLKWSHSKFILLGYLFLYPTSHHRFMYYRYHQFTDAFIPDIFVTSVSTYCWTAEYKALKLLREVQIPIDRCLVFRFLLRRSTP